MRLFAALLVLVGAICLCVGAFAWHPIAGYLTTGFVLLTFGLNISKALEKQDKQVQLDDTLQKIKDMMN